VEWTIDRSEDRRSENREWPLRAAILFTFSSQWFPTFWTPADLAGPNASNSGVAAMSASERCRDLRGQLLDPASRRQKGGDGILCLGRSFGLGGWDLGPSF
jgi:hypothetical protein